MPIQIGIPCVYPWLCNAISTALAIIVVVLLVRFVVYVVRQIRKNHGK